MMFKLNAQENEYSVLRYQIVTLTLWVTCMESDSFQYSFMAV